MESSHKLVSIAISGIPKELTKPEIEKIFKEFGNVVECHTDCPTKLPQSSEKTRATVKYESKIEAATAIARLDRQPPLHLRVDWIGLETDGKGDKRLSGVSIRGAPKFSNVSLGEQSLELQSTEQVGHQLYVPPAITDPCANCSRDGKLRCSRCKTWYCSAVCQENDWKIHRQDCYGPPPLENPDGTIYNRSHDTTMVTVTSQETIDTTMVTVTSQETIDTTMVTIVDHDTTKVTLVNHNTTMSETGTTAETLNSTLKEGSQAMAVKQDVLFGDLGVKDLSQPTQQVSNVCGGKPLKASHIEIDNKLIQQKNSCSKVSTCESINVSGSTLKSSEISVPVEKDKNFNKDIPPGLTEIPAETKAHGQVTSTAIESQKSQIDSKPFDFSNTLVTVSHAVSPDQFYVIPESSKELFESIVIDIQDQPDSVPVIKPGQICLAKHDDLWYRSEIIKVSSDGKKASLVFIDFGNHEEIDVTEIKSLEIYKDVAGMAVRVKMAGLGPAQENWSTEEIENFKEIVDEGGETKFSATLAGLDSGGAALVNLVDEDKKDVASRCVTKINHEKQKIRPSCADVGDQSDDANNKVKDGQEKPDEKIEGLKSEDVKKSVNNALGGLKIVTENDVISKENSHPDLKFSIPTEVHVIDCVSPREMVVLPSSKADQWNEIVTSTQDPSEDTVHPNVGQLYLANHDDLWYRALLQKLSPDKTQVKVDLVDFGVVGLKLKVGDLRELKIFNEVEPLAVRVGLAGLGVEGENWGEKKIEMFKQIVDVGGETQFIVQSLGISGGVEMVAMKDAEGSDVKEMCLELEIGIKVDETFTSVEKSTIEKEKEIVNLQTVVKSKSKKEGISHQAEPNGNTQMEKKDQKSGTHEMGKSETSDTEKMVEHSDILGKQIQQSLPKFDQDKERNFPRSSLPTDRVEQVSVCFAESPTKFYVTPTSKSSLFAEILLACQEMHDGRVCLNIGSVCLVLFEECWYRAEVEKVSPDRTKAKVFLLDYGKTVKAAVSELKPLNQFMDVPGLVCEVGLDGVKPAGTQWSQEEVDNFNLVVDAGGETKFTIRALGVDGEGGVRVQMKDEEDNDITQLCLSAGVGVACDVKLEENTKKMEEIEKKKADVKSSKNTKSNVEATTNSIKKNEEKATPSEYAISPMLIAVEQSDEVKTEEKLTPFEHTILPLNTPTDVTVSYAENPSKILLLPSSKNEKFMEILEGCQNQPDGFVNPTVGLVCLAFDEVWYRAKIEKISQDSQKVTVFLVDCGKTIETPVKALKQMSQFGDVPGLVVEAGLINLGCGEDTWPQESLDNLKIVLDVEGETTFTATSLGKDEDGVLRVKMVDQEGNDVSHFCVEMGIGLKIEHNLKSPELKDTKEKKIVSKSTRSKPASPLKPAPPLKNPIPVEASTLKNSIPVKNDAVVPKSADQASRSSEKIPPSPTRLPGCSGSILSSLIPGSKLQLMKDAESPLTNFSSICMVDDQENINYLLEDFQTAAAKSRVAGLVSSFPSLRSWVVGWSPEDEMYYRAVMVAVTAPDSYTALLIDFGMTQTFRKADLLEMWSEAASRKAMAIQLTAVDELSPEAEKTGNAYFVTNPTVDGYVVEKNKEDVILSIPAIGGRFKALPWFHCDDAAKDLFQQDQALADTDAPSGKENFPTPGILKDLQTNGLVEGASEFSSQVLMKDLKTSALVDGANVKYCGHGDKLCDVYVKQEMDEEKVASLMTTLNLSMCSRDSRDFREPMIGSIVAVKWSEDKDKMTYRASVTAINPVKKKAKLLLIDYGNRIVEDWTNITWLPNEVRKSPMYCVPVVLADVPASPSRQHTQIIDNVAREFGNKWVRLACVANVSPPTVKLLAGNKTLNSALIVGDEDISEKEKKRLEIARQIALLEKEMSNI